MSICVGCGDVELFWVPSCGDAAVGDSVLLLFGEEGLSEVDSEIKLIDEKFKAIDDAREEDDPDAVIAAQDQVTATLNNYIDPMSTLPGQHLVQAYRMKAQRWTYVRSDRMRNHLRRYPVDRSLLEATAGPDGQNRLDLAQLNQAFGAARERIVSDIKQGFNTPSGTLIKGDVSAGILDGWADEWAQWVDAVNASLSYSSKSANHQLDAGAQLMRAYAGFKANLGYNREEGTYGLSASGSARAVLAEAKATLTGYLPHVDGWHALIEYGANGSSVGTQQQADFGYFRFSAAISVHAMLGASVMGTAGVEYKPQNDGSILALPAAEGAKGTVSLEAFAGVEAGGDVKGAMEWDNPEKRGSNGGQPGWAPMIEIGVGVAANAGAGASLEVYIGYENGKFTFRAKGQAVLGIGAKGEMTGTVGIDAIFDFVTYVYHMLKDNNFSFLTFVSTAAFEAMKTLVLYLIREGAEALGELASSVSDVFGSMKAAVESDFAGGDMAEKYAISVKSRPEILYFASPEVKGAILYRLSETFVSSREEHQEAAILVVMETIQTRREWEKVIERVTPGGTPSTAAAGLSRLNWVLDGGSQRKFNAALVRVRNLPYTVDAGTPVNRSVRL